MFRQLPRRAIRTLRSLLDLSPKDQTLRLLDPSFVGSCNSELSSATANEVFEAVRVFSRVHYCPMEIREPLSAKINESIQFARDAELSELCLRVGMFPDVVQDIFAEVQARDAQMSALHLAGAFCGLAQVRGASRLSHENLCDLIYKLNNDEILMDLHSTVLSTLGLTAATSNAVVPNFFPRLYGAMNVSSLKGRHCANTWLMVATNDDWPVAFMTRLDARTQELLAADDLAMDDCVTAAWALTSLEYTSEKLMRPLVERLVKFDVKKFTVAQENQLHQIGLSLKFRPPSWDVPAGLLSPMPVGEEVPLLEETGIVAAWLRDNSREPQENARVGDFYHADILLDRTFIVTRPEAERDPWVRLKKRHLEALGYNYYCVPHWDSLSNEERMELL